VPLGVIFFLREGVVMPFVSFALTLLQLYFWVVIVNVVLNWLLTLGALNGSNPLIRNIYSMTAVVTEPALRKIRMHVKPVSGIDFSPLILILGVQFVRSCLEYYLLPYVARHGW
jgi:YggT family protein